MNGQPAQGEGHCRILGPRATIGFTLNGQPVSVEIDLRDMLLDVLRDQFDLTGAKRSCDLQVCGACTVLLDGRPVSACTLLAYEARGRQVETVEGLAQGGQLHPLQEAFIVHNAFQCGFCTPGMLLAAKALLAENPSPDRETIAAYLEGNICRCTGYEPVVRAVEAAAAALGATLQRDGGAPCPDGAGPAEAVPPMGGGHR